jgi:hypothetical protein
VYQNDLAYAFFGQQLTQMNAYIRFCASQLNSAALLQKLVETRPGATQGCQMVYFQTKNTNLGKFWRFLSWNILVYVMAIW